MAKNEIIPQINEVNRISSGSEFRGTLISSCDIRIDGLYVGKIQTRGKVVIGETAQYTGDIYCNSIDVWGKVDGNIISGNQTGFKNSADFTGSLRCHKIFIEEGAQFNGTCKMITEEEFNQEIAKLNTASKPESEG
ncbi:MAG: polymer-forming cytoskeletal protein [Bacteroidales bacterium]|nr:polymer-forming cytoskeletal protein [Bacteroidales bacterium]MDD2424770.1 polymer-forming cytoskeletal protein [Bacteroidales bacterium]MDD3988662.1 polymer-forming cytoskeletal protein [Bacteroidales bacterium]MDD4638984.1 polymer-forming cytoskeletal protein [Bacteroidales bacterium]